MTRTLLAAAALSLAGPASAGPITWGYGTKLVEWEGGRDGGPFDPWRLTPATGAASGSGTVTLFVLAPYTTGKGLIPGDFNAQLSVTDSLSGASHTFAFAGLASYSFRDGSERPDEGIDFDPFAPAQRALIGDHEYTAAYAGSHTTDGRTIVYSAAVTVAETPEPATALLAALGLAGVAGRLAGWRRLTRRG